MRAADRSDRQSRAARLSHGAFGERYARAQRQSLECGCRGGRYVMELELASTRSAPLSSGSDRGCPIIGPSR